MRRLIILLLLVLASININAQRYAVDPLFSDSAEMYVAVKAGTAWKRSNDIRPVMIAKGTLVDSCGNSDSQASLIVSYKGKAYCMHKDNLKFSEENAAEVATPFSAKHAKRHSSFGYFFASTTPIYIVCILFAVSFVLCWIARKTEALRIVALIVITFSILAVTTLELAGYYFLGGDVFWFCDYDRYGFFGSLWRVIPFILVVAYQIMSIFQFESCLFPDDPAFNGKEMSVKPAFISIAACIPVTIGFLIINQLVLKLDSKVNDIITIAIFLITLLSGVLYTLKLNIQRLGIGLGILLTLFTLFYIIGCLVALGGLIVVLVQLIIQVLMVVGAIIMFLLLGKDRYYRGSDGHIYVESGLGGPRRVD